MCPSIFDALYVIINNDVYSIYIYLYTFPVITVFGGPKMLIMSSVCVLQCI